MRGQRRGRARGGAHNPRYRQARRVYSPSPPTSPRIELPIESRSPSPVALRIRERSADFESPIPDNRRRRLFVDDGEDEDFVRGNVDVPYRRLPSNWLKFKKEVKHYQRNYSDVDVSSFNSFNTAVVRWDVCNSLMDIPMGLPIDRRNTDAITVVRIAMKFWFYTFYDYNSAGGILNPPPVGMPKFDTKQNLRLCLIKDRQSNGVSAASIFDSLIWDENFFPGSHDLSYRAPATLSRFDMLYDKVHCIEWDPPTTYGVGAAPGVAGGVGWYPQKSSEPVEVYIDMPFDVTWAPGNAVPTTNNVFLFAYPGPMISHAARYQVSFIGQLTMRASFVEK